MNNASLRALRPHVDTTPQAATAGNLYEPVEVHEACVHGSSPPRLSTPRFAAWTARELVHMAMETPARVRHALRVRHTSARVAGPI